MKNPCIVQGNYVCRFDVLLFSEQKAVVFNLHTFKRRK